MPLTDQSIYLHVFSSTPPVPIKYGRPRGQQTSPPQLGVLLLPSELPATVEVPFGRKKANLWRNLAEFRSESVVINHFLSISPKRV